MRIKHEHALSLLVDDLVLDCDKAQLFLLPHFPHDERRSYRVSDEHRLCETKPIDPVKGHQRLLKDSQPHPQTLSYRERKNSVRDPLVEDIPFGKLLVGVERVEVSAHSSKVCDISVGNRPTRCSESLTTC